MVPGPFWGWVGMSKGGGEYPEGISGGRYPGLSTQGVCTHPLAGSKIWILPGVGLGTHPHYWHLAVTNEPCTVGKYVSY